MEPPRRPGTDCFPVRFLCWTGGFSRAGEDLAGLLRHPVVHRSCQSAVSEGRGEREGPHLSAEVIRPSPPPRCWSVHPTSGSPGLPRLPSAPYLGTGTQHRETGTGSCPPLALLSPEGRRSTPPTQKPWCWTPEESGHGRVQRAVSRNCVKGTKMHPEFSGGRQESSWSLWFAVWRGRRQKKGDEARTPAHERKPESFSGKTLLTCYFQKSVPC